MGAHHSNRSALLVVDVQNDFCPGGALAVPQGDRVVPVLNRWIARFAERAAPIYASRDWHPATTIHFAPQGGPWPVHCVANTAGAEFHPALRLPPSAIIVSKGMKPDEHGYSPFDGQTTSGVSLVDDLRQRGIKHLFVGGLATDYCVKNAVLDGLRSGLAVTVLEDAVAGVEVQPGDSARAVAEMRDAGAQFVAGEPRDMPAE
jgi:nicotinamidase/pyrazinamidase